MKANEIIKNGRQMLKPDWESFDYQNVDGNKGIPPLPIQMPFDINAKQIELIPFNKTNCGNKPLPQVMANRHSTREFAETELSLEELSYLLWTTQGLKTYDDEYGFATKAVPSGGGCHCIETYLYINRVEGIEQGIYKYLPKDQRLVLINTEAVDFFNAAVTFLWSAIPYKMEYGYSTVAHKMIAIEAGHVCQNLYLAAESIDCGCCAVGAYNQHEIDTLLGINSEDEFVIYIGAVGKYI